MLQEILEKPEHHRRKLAYLATFVVGVFIFSAWLMIASFNVKQAFDPFAEEEEALAQDFRSTLPSLRQENSVTTELVKNPPEAEEAAPQEVEEEEKPFWKRIFE
jgi:hypothetical protein